MYAVVSLSLSLSLSFSLLLRFKIVQVARSLFPTYVLVSKIHCYSDLRFFSFLLSFSPNQSSSQTHESDLRQVPELHFIVRISFDVLLIDGFFNHFLHFLHLGKNNFFNELTTSSCISPCFIVFLDFITRTTAAKIVWSLSWSTISFTFLRSTLLIFGILIFFALSVKSSLKVMTSKR